MQKHPVRTVHPSPDHGQRCSVAEATPHQELGTHYTETLSGGENPPFGNKSIQIQGARRKSSGRQTQESHGAVAAGSRIRALVGGNPQIIEKINEVLTNASNRHLCAQASVRTLRLYFSVDAGELMGTPKKGYSATTGAKPL